MVSRRAARGAARRGVRVISGDIHGSCDMAQQCCLWIGLGGQRLAARPHAHTAVVVDAVRPELRVVSIATAQRIIVGVEWKRCPLLVDSAQGFFDWDVKQLHHAVDNLIAECLRVRVGGEHELVHRSLTDRRCNDRHRAGWPCDTGEDVVARQRRILCQQVVDRIASGDEVQHSSHRDTRSLQRWLAVADVGMNDDLSHVLEAPADFVRDKTASVSVESGTQLSRELGRSTTARLGCSTPTSTSPAPASRSRWSAG